MAELSPQELIDLLSPRLASLFELDKSRVSSDLQQELPILNSFIQESDKTLLLAQKTDRIVLQTSFSYSSGPVLLCQKTPEVLTQLNYQSNISIFSLPASNVLPFLQALVGQFFLPYLQNAIPVEDKMAKGVIDTLSDFEIAISRFQHKSQIPKPVLNLADDAFQLQTTDDISTSKESEIVIATEKWQTSVGSLTNYVENPPQFDNIRDEISFWPLASEHLHLVQDQITKLKASQIPSIVSRTRKLFVDFINSKEKEIPKLIEQIDPFASAVSQLDIDGYDEVNDIVSLQDKIKDTFLFFDSFFSKSTQPGRINLIYNLTDQFIQSKIIGVLSKLHLPIIPHESFKKSITMLEELYTLWRSEEKTMIKLVEKILTFQQITELNRIATYKDAIYQRVHELAEVKENYHTILRYLTSHTELESTDIINELEQAYEVVSSVKYLEFSDEATIRWKTTVSECRTRIEKVENDIGQIISSMLASCSTLVQIQAVFKQHQVICSRPTVHLLLRQSQQMFLAQFNEQLELLMKEQANIIKLPIITYMLVHGTTADSSKLLQLRRIEHIISCFETMLTDVIGPRWMETTECESIRASIKACKDGINKSVTQDLAKLMKIFKMCKTDCLIKPVYNVSRIKNEWQIKCDYSPLNANTINTFRTLNQFLLVKDVDAVEVMLKMPKSYKFYLRIQESLNTFITLIQTMKPSLKQIACEQIESIYQLILKGFGYKWNSKEMKKYSKEFTQAVGNFSTDIVHTKSLMDQIEQQISNIEKSQSKEELTEIIGLILTKVDKIFCSKMTNYEQFVHDLNQRIAELITNKVTSTCISWRDSLKSNRNIPRGEPILVKISLSGNRILVTPPFELIHPLLNHQFVSHINDYISQSQIITMNSNEVPLFRGLIPIPHDLLHEIFLAMDALSQAVSEYVKEWVIIQPLFVTEPTSIDFGNNIGQWVQFIEALEAQHSHFKKCPPKKVMCIITIDTSSIQKSVVERISKWKDIILNALRTNAQQFIEKLLDEVAQSRSIMELPIPSKARDLATYLTNFKDCSKKKVSWDLVVPELHKAAQHTPLDGFSKLTSGIESFNQIFDSRQKEIEVNSTTLRSQVTRESESLEKSIDGLKKKWNNDRPLNGDILPEKALQILAKYKVQFEKAKGIWAEISAAREALGLQIFTNDILEAMVDDCESMTEVWTLLSTVWAKLSTHLKQPFSSFVPTEFKSKIGTLQEKLQQMPNTVRDYEAWVYFNQKLKNILRIFPVLEGLKSPAILPRHWSQVSQQFKTKINLDTITVQEIMEFDLEKNNDFFSEVIRNAQGEFSLHQYLESLDSTWNALEFEFSNYKDRMTLIKSWDAILTQISDHLGSLTNMQTSPFFQVFREQAIAWETKLNQLQVLLDEWLDVQRHFIYLEGVFNSPDIRTILAKATASFKKCEKEFVTISKRAQQLKVVMKIMTIPNIGTTLSSLMDNLTLLQKELSDYLEKQRSFFPRFFFIGDEDLLEIIGKSSAINEISRHFGKMFEGLTGVDVKDNNILSMNCGDGECVKFNSEVPISNAIYQTLNEIEKEMRTSLKVLLLDSVKEFQQFWESMSLEKLQAFIEKYPAQIVLLSFYVISTIITEKYITKKENQLATNEVIQFIGLLSQLVFTDLSVRSRHSVQQLITECVHQRNLSRELESIDSVSAFEWTRFMRFYHDPVKNDLIAKVGDASFNYGFEYLGLCPSLVRTPLTDRVYLTMAQALYAKMGGSPFGPAGTGKTETVKNMGHHLGRHVLVFNCDETFDFKAMGRIFLGLCHCGSWGCFDEFNRLDEQMLSAVSQQIQTIQFGLKANQKTIQILGKKAPLNQSMGIFITMNPGYAGRVELPDNLKQLFRTMAMIKPDTELITEVLLFSQGFSCAEQLAPKFVALFSMAKESLSHQTHYDFGLRAMKAVLTNAGHLIRSRKIPQDDNRYINESRLLISSIVNTLFPKLLSHDLARLQRLMNDIFPGIKPEEISQEKLLELLKEQANENGWIDSDIWMNKIIQLYYIQQICHGFMLVGPSATGKTSSRTTLLKVLSKLDEQESESYVINPKSVTKDTLFGFLDPVSREWTDGVFTRILRTIVDNQRGEMNKRHWIVFDGDVDPEWVENLNSVLDDNKLLTLPNGERISLPPNVRIVFEVENLNFATPATVSRCGIVFFSSNTLKFDEIVKFHIHQLSKNTIITPNHILYNDYIDVSVPDMLAMQENFSTIALPTLLEAIKVCQGFWKQYSSNAIMEIPPASCLSTLFAILASSFVSMFRTQQNDILILKSTIFATYWAFALPFNSDYRQKLDTMMHDTFRDLAPEKSFVNYYLSFETEDWVNVEELKSEKTAEEFVMTSFTEVMRRIIQMVMTGEDTVVLCGPNGVGKQSLLSAALAQYQEIETINLNFSNCSTIDFVLQTLEQYCAYIKSSNMTRLKPKTANTFIVFECNNLNLPALDKYGTQRVVEFLRQLLELNGFWHPHRREWIQLELIAFSGVCSPPSAFGRVKLSSRFLRHSSVICIEHPPIAAVRSIISTILDDGQFQYQDEVCGAVGDFYLEFREHFRSSENVHYIANMRDIMRWIRSFKFALTSSRGIDVSHLLYHEGCRVFADRLEEPGERDWVAQIMQSNVLKHFADADVSLFQNPWNYTRLVNNQYSPYETSQILPRLQSKLKQFNEESNSNEIVFFDECIDLICHVERRLHEPNGHMLIVGHSGTGKTLIPTFVSHYNDMPTFRLRVHKSYNLVDFDADLRKILRACLDQPITFIIKDTDILLPVFTERLNVLLADSRIPGLFAGDELQSLQTAIKDAARSAGQLLDNEESMNSYFIEKVHTNLHVVFTINSATVNMNETDITFPSLLASSTIIWIGTWSDASLSLYSQHVIKQAELQVEDSTIEALLKLHHSAVQTSESLPVTNYISPQHFFDFVHQFTTIYIEKRERLNTDQQHYSNGLSKLEETQKEVTRMGKDLTVKQGQLKEKEQLAEQKLQEILKDTQVTSGKKEEAQKIKVVLDEKRKIIDTESLKAKAELDSIAPIIEEAKSSVSKIKKANLDEIRRLASPPDVIQKTLQAVVLLLDNGSATNSSTWNGIKKYISGEQFIRLVIDFKIDNTASSTIKKVVHMIETSELTFDKAQRASQACGPLFKWLNATIKYQSIVESTAPLRAKVESYEAEALALQKQHDDMSSQIKSFERKMRQLKSEYNSLISECDKTKIEAEQVKVKLNRSTELLSSLTSETKRWVERRDAFQEEKINLIGHSILSASFVAYTGFLEQQRRMDLLRQWMNTLEDLEIKYSENYQTVDFMVDPKVLIDWGSKQLPKDDLCIQNAIILTSHKSKTPLIVDPAGQATGFLMNSYPNIIKTSFSDPKFPKSLESSLRFGSPLLIEDGENLDPIVLPVITREFRRAGGRTLLELKHNEIDVSPSFQMFVITRDTDFAPPPSLASMTVLVNFSVTSLSLRAQCLTRLLQFKLPDIEKRRRELHESLAAMQVQLRIAEDGLLTVFSSTKGEILENDQTLHQLEEVKEEAIQIEQKATETRQTLQEITEVSEQYSPVAEIATSLYFALRDMGTVYFLYQFSLQFFWSIFDRIVAAEASPQELIVMIAKGLFTDVSYSLLNKHLPILGFRFGQILLEQEGINIEESLFDLALRGSTLRGREPDFMTIVTDKNYEKWIKSDAPEADITDDVLEKMGNNDHPAVSALKVLALMRRARPDRIVAAARLFVKNSFNFSVDDIPPLSIPNAATQTGPNTPLLLMASVGHDPSDRVETAAIRPVESLAVGAADSYAAIEQTVQSAAQRGNWVIIKNVHLAPLWTRSFVKNLQNIRAHPDFRIFLTSEINPKVGSNVFRTCRVIVFESATGIRANLRRVYSSGFQWPNIPQERQRLVINFLWLHAAVMERLRFEPLGWSKRYEFNDADLKFSLQVGLRWVEQAASGRSHLAQEQFPWSAIRFLISSCVYGGRVDSPSDMRLLKAMADMMFAPGALIGDGLITAPEIHNIDELKSWVDSMPSDESPELLWLPRNSGKFLFIQQGNETLQHILSVQAGSSTGSQHENKQANFVKLLLEQWVEKLEETEANSFKAPETSLIASCIEDELTQLRKTRAVMLSDIKEILNIFQEGDSLDQKNMKIINCLARAAIPDTWNKHQFMTNDLNVWIDDFIERIKHLNLAASDDKYGRGQMDLGLLKSPESLLAAAKQEAATINKWPVEKIKMHIKVGETTLTSDADIVATGVSSLCAEWGQNGFMPSEEVTGKMPALLITWSLEEDKNGILISCFMTNSKKRPVFEAVMPVSNEKSNLWWTIRNPAVILQSKGL